MARLIHGESNSSKLTRMLGGLITDETLSKAIVLLEDAMADAYFQGFSDGEFAIKYCQKAEQDRSKNRKGEDSERSN